MQDATNQEIVDAVNSLELTLVEIVPWLQAIAIGACVLAGLLMFRLVLIGKNNRRLW